MGRLIEVLTTLTCIGSAVALYPVIKRYGQGRAVGFGASRVANVDGFVEHAPTARPNATIR